MNLQLSPESALRSGGAISEPVPLIAGPRNKFVLGRPLWDVKSIGVEVVLEL
jgi:hypothetical protein